MSRFPETIFKERVTAKLKNLPNTWFYKTQEVSKRGIPDIIMCVRGFFVALELKKSEKDKLDPLQKYTLDKIDMGADGHAFEVNPDNWEGVYIFLTKLARKR